MNYRHIYHAGNFADIFKHVILTRVLVHMLLKDKPFRAIDSHAGLGLYDVSAEQSARTGEWHDGLGRISEPFLANVENLLAPYRAVIKANQQRHGDTFYPGSPKIMADFLRAQDKGVFVEKHPEDFITLKNNFIYAPQVKVLHLDAWTALRSLLPPPEKRGLVLIDPPFEQPDEWLNLVKALLNSVQRWRTGTYLMWYPIKNPVLIAPFLHKIQDAMTQPILNLELMIKPVDGVTLAGCGMLVINPPWTLASEAKVLIPALKQRLKVG